MNDDKKWEKVTAGEQADAWEFKTDKNISGRYVEKRTGLGQKNSTMYILEKEDGVLAGVWETATLKSKFDNVRVGDEVKIEYTGLVKAQKGGNDYHGFNFHVHRSAGPAPVTATTATADDTEDIFDDMPTDNVPT